jgi:hypothetical protein
MQQHKEEIIKEIRQSNEREFAKLRNDLTAKDT